MPKPKIKLNSIITWLGALFASPQIIIKSWDQEIINPIVDNKKRNTLKFINMS